MEITMMNVWGSIFVHPASTLVVLTTLLGVPSTQACQFAAQRSLTCGISEIVVFGDSVSDNGVNYVQDTHGLVRKSNGKVWPEYLADLLGSDSSPVPLTDMAHSGATTGWGNLYFSEWSGIQWQIQKFKRMTNSTVSRNTLVILQSGGINDLEAEYPADMILDNLERAIKEILALKHLANLMVLGLTDVMSMPAFRNKSKVAVDVLAEKNEYIQLNLPRVAGQLMDNIPQSSAPRFLYFDTAFAQQGILAKFADHQRPLVLQQAQGEQDARRYAWFDEWHMTTGPHFLLANQITRAMKNKWRCDKK